MTGWRRLAGLLRPQLGWLALGVLLALITGVAVVGLLAVSGGLLAAAAVSGLAAAGAWPPLINQLSAAIRLFALLRTAGRYGERLLTHDATLRVLASLRGRFFARLLDRGIGPAGGRRSGDLLQQLTADIDELAGGVARALTPGIAALLLALAMTALLARTDPVLTIGLAALFVLGVLILPLASYRLSVPTTRDALQGARNLRTRVVESLGGAAEIALFDARERFLDAVARADHELLLAQRRQARLRGRVRAGAILIAGLALIAALLLGLGVPDRPALSPTVLAAVVLAVLGFFEVASPLAPACVDLGRTHAALGRLGELLDAPPVLARPMSPAVPPADHALQMDGVTAGYDPAAPPVLRDIRLTLPPGSHVAVLGPSGSGKTTLAHLLVRLRDPMEGRITLGGVDLRDLAEHDLRDRITLVEQRPHLFDGTLRENLCLARPDADDDALHRALAISGMTGRAADLGLDTRLGTGGVRLSGGEARRVALARALLLEAPVLILDEPLEDLDAASGAALLQGLLETAGDRTVLVLTHRLPDPRAMDQIVLLERGTIIEQGDHETLLAAKGRYATLQDRLRDFC